MIELKNNNNMQTKKVNLLHFNNLRLRSCQKINLKLELEPFVQALTSGES